jgi:hypothetical protein
MLGVHQELDRVPSPAAAVAVAGEDVVLEDEGVGAVDDGAEDLFHLAVVLDRLDHPATPLELLARGRNAPDGPR